MKYRLASIITIVLLEIIAITLFTSAQGGFTVISGTSKENVTINIVIIVALFVLILKLIKNPRKRSLAGIGVFLIGLTIVAFTFPISMVMWNARNGELDHCVEPWCTIINLNGTLPPNSKLVQIFSDLQERFSIRTTDNYFQEWFLINEIASSTNDKSMLELLSRVFNGVFYLQYEGKHYGLSFEHLESRWGYLLEPNTFSTFQIILLNIVITTGFYLVVLKSSRKSKQVNNT